MRAASLLAHPRALHVAAGLLAALLVWLLLQSFVWLEQERHHQAEHARLQAEVASVRARLESELNASLSLSLGLSTFVLVKPDFAQDEFAQVAASLIRLNPGIRNVALAPDNVIRFVYPYRENRKALGLDFLETPAQRDAVLRLMRDLRPVIAGPIELVQGGIGIVNRIPIVFTQPDGSPRYWGLASVAINPLPIFERAGVLPTGDAGGIRYALRGRDGLGAQGEVFLGDAALFADPEAVLTDVVIPGGSWQLAARAAPAAGWGWGWGTQALLIILSAIAGALVTYTLSAHERIRSMALHDQLTGLANRYQFNLRGQDLFALAKRSGRPLTLLNIDINDFKSVNDTYGHAAGDAVLIQVANMLQSCCRESDLVARVGGDEFLVLMPDTAMGPSLEKVIERLRDAINVLLPGVEVSVKLNISIGVASLSGETASLDSLMNQADVAMYRAKEGATPEFRQAQSSQ